jgi:biopolymer transport protein ExbD
MRGKKEGDSKIVLPITPMLDMTFQLLFFFIMSFNPADLEGAVDMALPSEQEKAAHKKDDVDPRKASDKDPTPEFPSDLTVKVRTQMDGVNDGEISAISVRNLEGKEDPITDPKSVLVGLTKYLTDKRQGLTNKDGVKLQGDGKLKVRSIVKVMDACRAAGFTNISFVLPEDFGR